MAAVGDRAVVNDRGLNRGRRSRNSARGAIKLCHGDDLFDSSRSVFHVMHHACMKAEAEVGGGGGVVTRNRCGFVNVGSVQNCILQ